MTRTEELSQNLRLEYLFYQRYLRWQQEGRLSKNGQTRLKNTIKAILSAKEMCRRELPEEEYPEEYYYEDPEELSDPVPQPEEKLATINKPKGLKPKIPDNDGTQMNIMDYMHDRNICWRI